MSYGYLDLFYHDFKPFLNPKIVNDQSNSCSFSKIVDNNFRSDRSFDEIILWISPKYLSLRPPFGICLPDPLDESTTSTCHRNDSPRVPSSGLLWPFEPLRSRPHACQFPFCRKQRQGKKFHRIDIDPATGQACDPDLPDRCPESCRHIRPKA